jgi:hypothetical protein
VPFCPRCAVEYRPDFDTCSDCGVALVDDLPDEPYAPPDPNTNDVAVVRHGSSAMLEMWAELLRSHNIGCRIVPAGAGDSIYPQALSTYELRVAAIDAAHARDILPPSAQHASQPMADLTQPSTDLADDEPSMGFVRLLTVAGVALIVLLVLVVLLRVFS